MKKILDRALFKLETHALFYPMRKHMPPLNKELVDVTEDVYFETSDGLKLNGWYIEGTFGRPVIIYCHGQAENIGYYQEPMKVLFDNGYGVFAIDYRGHGKSEGKPTEQGVYEDVEAAISELARRGIDPKDIVIWGRSLGGAIAAEMATRYKFKGAILESTFTRIQDAASSIINMDNNHEVFSPSRKMLFRLANILPTYQEFNTEDKMANIKCPVLIGHSEKDNIINYKLAKRNAKKNSNARLFISKEGTHDYSEWFYDEALRFLEDLQA